MKLHSGSPYWDSLASSAVASTPIEFDVRCQVLVLGAGITGALVAYKLAKNGVDVILVDQRDFGEGSTVASTGLLQYEVDTPLCELIAKVGEQNAVHAYRRGLAAINEIEAEVADLGDSCGFVRRESLYFAARFWHYRKLKQEFECRRRFGFDVDFLEREQLAEISSLRAAGAIRSRGAAQIDPFHFTKRLIQKGATLGVRTSSNTSVTEINEHDDAVEALTPKGTIRADKIVYATGYETSQFQLTDCSAVLHSTYALVSQPNFTVPGWPDDCLIWETARPYFYARRTSDGRAMIGGGDTAYANDHDRDGLVQTKIKQLVARFQQLFPQASLVPDYTWAGTFAETKDGLAYIGQPADRPRAYFALGYGGNGITFSVIAAQLICDLYLGRPNPDTDVFRFGR